jgi:hypothetical protein
MFAILPLAVRMNCIGFKVYLNVCTSAIGGALRT